MIAPDVSIIDLEPEEWARLSRHWFGTASREIQVLRRGDTTLSSVGPSDVDIPTCDTDDVQAWCDAVRADTGVDRVTVFDADALDAFARRLVERSATIATQGDLLLAAAAAVVDEPGIVSSPPYLPPRLAPLLESIRSVDGWTLLVCGDDDSADWTVLAEIRDRTVVTLSTATHVTDRRPPEISVVELASLVAGAVDLRRVVAGTWEQFAAIIEADDPLAALAVHESST